MNAQRLPDLARPIREFVTPIDTTIQAEQSLSDAIRALRSRRLRQDVIYFYVVDADGRLVGVVPTRRLLLGDPAQPVQELMSKAVVSLPDSATLEAALEEFAIHRLLALPVVDAEGRLLGVVDVRVYAEEVFDMAQTHRADDIFQFIGLSVDQAKHGTAAAGFRMRMPWLLCNMASGVLCAVIAAVFRDALAAVVLLAMFIPLVLTLSESVSMQAMTTGLQFLHRQQVPWQSVRTRLAMEWKTAAMIGVVSGILVGLASLLWGGGSVPGGGISPPAVVLAVAIAGSMVIASLVGLAVPVLLHVWRLEPKVASGPVVLMIADVIATTSYLGLATWWLL